LRGRARPSPPENLDAAERRAWHAVVDASPGGFIDAAGQIILRQVVTQVAISERHAHRLRKMAEANDEDLEVERSLAKAHSEAMRNTIIGMTALRATPRSRDRPRDAGRTFDRETPSGQTRPWEVRAPTLEAEACDSDETA
jgi:hypothetical protein